MLAGVLVGGSGGELVYRHGSASAYAQDAADSPVTAHRTTRRPRQLNDVVELEAQLELAGSIATLACEWSTLLAAAHS